MGSRFFYPFSLSLASETRERISAASAASSILPSPAQRSNGRIAHGGRGRIYCVFFAYGWGIVGHPEVRPNGGERFSCLEEVASAREIKRGAGAGKASRPPRMIFVAFKRSPVSPAAAESKTLVAAKSAPADPLSRVYGSSLFRLAH